MTTTIKVKGSALPADTITPEVMDGWSMARASSSNIINVPGRSKPVVVMHPVGSRRGSLKLVCATMAKAQALDALLARQTVYTVSDTDRGIVAMDFVIDAEGYTLALDDETRDVWTVTIAAVEV